MTQEVRRGRRRGRSVPPGRVVEMTDRGSSSDEFPERLRPVLEATRPDRGAFPGCRQAASTSSAARCVTSSPGGREAASRVRRPTSTSPRTPLPTRSKRWWPISPRHRGPRARGSGRSGCMRAGRRFEITTHRAEAYVPESRKPEVRFGRDIETDLSRRDFTVNAMALSLPDLELVDPFDGIADLADQPPAHAARSRGLLLRRPLADAPGRPVHRRLRARARAELVSAVKAMAVAPGDRLQGADPRRAGQAARPARSRRTGLWFLVDTGLAAGVPSRASRARPRAGPDPAAQGRSRPHDRRRREDQPRQDPAPGGAVPRRRQARSPARSAQAGSTSTTTTSSGRRWRESACRSCATRPSVIDDVARLVELHLRFHTYKMGWTDSAVRRYAHDAGPLLDRLNELTRCDCTTRNQAKARDLAVRMDELERRLAELARARGARRDPPAARRRRRHEAPRHRARARRRRRARVPAADPPRRGPCSTRTRSCGASTPGGQSAPEARPS